MPSGPVVSERRWSGAEDTNLRDRKDNGMIFVFDCTHFDSLVLSTWSTLECYFASCLAVRLVKWWRVTNAIRWVRHGVWYLIACTTAGTVLHCMSFTYIIHVRIRTTNSSCTISILLSCMNWCTKSKTVTRIFKRICLRIISSADWTSWYLW